MSSHTVEVPLANFPPDVLAHLKKKLKEEKGPNDLLFPPEQFANMEIPSTLDPCPQAPSYASDES